MRERSSLNAVLSTRNRQHVRARLSLELASSLNSNFEPRPASTSSCVHLAWDYDPLSLHRIPRRVKPRVLHSKTMVGLDDAQ